MQRHECNKHNYLCMKDSIKFLFPCKNQGVIAVEVAQPTGELARPSRSCMARRARRSPMAGLAFGLHVEHHSGMGDPPSKEKMTGSHQWHRAAMRWQRQGVSIVLGSGGSAWWPMAAPETSWSRRGR
jgi:hypothetical protein